MTLDLLKLILNVNSHKTVTLHGLGAMVLRAVSIALAIQQQLNNQIDLKPTTETITLIDDVIPEDVVKSSIQKL
jgi:ribonuclease P/MRP protein subunit RPP20